MFLLGQQKTNKGNMRETFFANQVGYKHKLTYAETADFTVDDKYIFELGGRNKTRHQLNNNADSYTVIDDYIIGSHNRIPLWIFGFLY